VRRIPLILAVVALLAGLGLIAAVFLGRDPAPAHDASFASGSPTGSAVSTGSAAPDSSAPQVSASAAPKPATVAKTTPYRFPVVGKAPYARTHHDYPASDIMAPCGAQVVSPVNGVVLEVSLKDTWTAKVNAGATRGGLAWSILGDDGVRYYGSHASSIDPAIRAGTRVTAGQKIAKVGDTGDASACHVHFGISPQCQKTGDWWIRRGVIFPWSYLDAWRAGKAKSPASAIAAWQAKNGCPTKAQVDP
jgi:murein DD-endopeptidase MepM/ murein hydrolase activator NlpD